MNEFEKRVEIIEVKRKGENLNVAILKQKASSLLKQFNGYSIEYKGLSMENM